MRHFTIIIPTRNRADTLYWSLKSCLAQDYERMTVLVSDNCSDDKTSEVIASFKDPRLAGIRTPSPTSMSGNLEFALSHALENDTHVTVFGDDDGLLPDGLAYANEIFSQHPGIEALTWTVSNYCWPSCLVDDWRNHLQLSLSSHVEVLSTHDMLAKLADYRVYYHHLPGLWTSLVSSSVLRACKARLGRILISHVPDAGSAVLIGCSIPSYLFTRRTVTLLGSSSHSVGLSASTGKSGAARQFWAESTIQPHPDLELTTGGVYVVTESLLQGRDLGLLPDGVRVNLPRALGLMLIRRASYADDVYAAIVQAVKTTAARHDIPLDLDAIDKQNREEIDTLFRDPIVTAHECVITHRCDPRITSNIHEAANLAAELLNAHQAREILTYPEHRRAVKEVKEKLRKTKERIQSLENKLVKTQQDRKRGFLGGLRRKLRALRGHPY